MAINPNEDTEFNDALRKHGILPPRPATPPSPEAPPSPTLEDELEDLDLDELKDAAEDAKDDETSRIIEQIRRERLAELKRFEQARFGRVYPIGRDDYTREVTEASKVDSDDAESAGKGTGVVCFLYKDGIPRSDRAFEHIRILSQRHPHTKFVSIVGDKCIPNIPDIRLPMFIIYRKGEVLNQIVAWGADRERKIEELEAVLILAGAIVPQHMPRPKNKDDDDASDDEGLDRDKSSRMKSSVASTNAKTPKNIRQNKDDDDSDFEFDL